MVDVIDDTTIVNIDVLLTGLQDFTSYEYYPDVVCTECGMTTPAVVNIIANNITATEIMRGSTGYIRTPCNITDFQYQIDTQCNAIASWSTGALGGIICATHHSTNIQEAANHGNDDGVLCYWINNGNTNHPQISLRDGANAAIVSNDLEYNTTYTVLLERIGLQVTLYIYQGETPVQTLTTTQLQTTQPLYKHIYPLMMRGNISPDPVSYINIINSNLNIL